MSSTLILVESPNKAKKIQEMLGRGAYVVKATVGHIADMPKEYGVDLTTFEESYEIRNPKVMTEIRQLAKNASTILLASDPDREGEAIAWHLARELKLKVATPMRLEFNEITKPAIQRAISQPRPVDMHRVDAQRVRRVLDRIVGYDVSKEICWPAGAQSAGRVQTPALHILCVREREIQNFVVEKYWTVGVLYEEGLDAFVPAGQDAGTGGTSGDSRDEDAGAMGGHGRIVPRKFATQAEADQVVATAKIATHVVKDVARKKTLKSPEPAYITSTVQQDASRKLRLSVKQTADLLQALFENGSITYHRTDSTRVSDEGQQMARTFIAQDKPQALAATPPKQRSKAGAQDAHEAIRPTHLGSSDEAGLPAGTLELYRMIRARFLASQCKPAEVERTMVRVEAGSVPFVAEGSVLLDPGYLAYWAPYAKQDDELLPPLTVGQTLAPKEWKAEQKQTQPPSRYDEGALVKKLEASGVGRPSTFAAIIDTLLKRNYVQEMQAGRGKKVLQPTAFGLQVDELMSSTFAKLTEEQYTKDMEDALETMTEGKGPSRVDYLRLWHADFRREIAAALPRAARYIAQHGLKPKAGPGRGEPTNVTCDRCGDATYNKIPRKVGRGSFLACPSCNMLRDVQAKTKPNGCQKCGSTLIEKRGKDSKAQPFFGCVRFGAAERPCDYIERADGKVGGRYTRDVTDKPCPRCQKKVLVLLTPRDSNDGTPFFACEDTSCKFTLPKGAKKRKDPCPDCGAAVLERRRRPTDEEKTKGLSGKGFWSCARYPDCKFAADIAPAADGASPGGAAVPAATSAGAAPGST